ncbi:MAG: hypothetical protein AAB772_02855 [Patescibacteria group bacterium]
MALKDLERELYRQKDEDLKPELSEKNKKNSRIEEKLSEYWQESSSISRQRKTPFFKIVASWGKLVFWLLILVLIGVIAVMGFLAYQYFSSQGVVVEIQGPVAAQIGVPFIITVNYSNNSGNIIKNGNLSLELPEGATLLGGSENQAVFSKEIGDFGSGSVSQESYRVLFTRGVNIAKRFSANLSYQLFSGGSRFEANGELNVGVKEPGVLLDLIMPTKVLSGEQFEIKVKYQNVSQIDFSGLKLQLDYPANFTFQEASLKPSSANNVWILGDLNKGSESEFVIKGQVAGPSNSFFSIGGKLSMSLLGRVYVINERSASLAISASPVELDIFVNGGKDYIAKAGDNLTYVINYHNNSGVGLAGVIVRAKLVGEMFDPLSLSTNGYFNSITDTLTWNTPSNPELALVPAGNSGSLSFGVKLKDDFPIKRLGDKNFIVKLSVDFESPTTPYNLASQKTLSLAEIQTKIAGRVSIQSKVYFRDAESGILNKGLFPPKVNQPTQYTVHWVITNYSTDIKNIEVRSFLEPGVSWAKIVKSNTGSLPVFNERTGEIIWTISDLPATKGVISEPAEAIFQIEAVPSLLHLGNAQPLIKQTDMKAFDFFVNVEFQTFAKEVTTALPDDLTVSQSGGRVEQ